MHLIGIYTKRMQTIQSKTHAATTQKKLAQIINEINKCAILPLILFAPCNRNKVFGF